ncbi:hypothetical protein K0H02_05635 [Bacteroides fragilis]|uniref:hypothetical protein n=1 Tax=Bacteroides fragilis TaxID=817 RepID=UPI00044CEE81|nr:hypothetical protein [Bacteroides fragilis]EYA64260.1 hypothetical protein M139_4469 [Bacteroides fragilis str. S23L24]MCE9334105.1 hypothetical protein [Bacteroides fragilis]
MKDLTTNERRRLLGFSPTPDNQSSEQLLAEKLGVGGTQSLVAIVSDPNLTSSQKQELLITLFSFTPEQAAKILE